MMSKTSYPPRIPQAGRKPRSVLARIVAATFTVAMLTAIAVPASAATTRAAAPDSPAVSAVTTTPDVVRWVFIHYYPSSLACRLAGGLYVESHGNAIGYRCGQTQEFDLIVWALYVEI
jgi:hypothetical protein